MISLFGSSNGFEFGIGPLLFPSSLLRYFVSFARESSICTMLDNGKGRHSQWDSKQQRPQGKTLSNLGSLLATRKLGLWLVVLLTRDDPRLTGFRRHNHQQR